MTAAIFGGTFDPVHTGHTNMALAAIEQFNLEKLVIVPNANPPHKQSDSYTDFCHRYNMLKLAFADMGKTEISDYEASNDKRHYSVDTMRHFRSAFGEETFFVIGADSLLTIHLWRDYKTLLKENRFIVFPREGDKELEAFIDKYRLDGAEIHLANAPHWNVSSTNVRQMLKEGTLPYDMLNDEVSRYIKDNGLYGGAK